MTDIINFQTEFIKLCEYGDIYQAADALFISETSLIKHMKQLENACEHRLFEKYSHPVQLTEFGQLYLNFARRYKELDAEMALAIADFDSKHLNTIMLAVAHSMNCDHIVNMLTDHFKEKYPMYYVSPGEFSRTVTLPQTFDMGYELVFAVGEHPTDDDYNCYQWSSDRLIAILPRNHALANEKSINLSQLASDKFLLFPEGSFLNYYVLSLCKKAGFEPKVDFTIHGTSNLSQLVSAGIGVSLTTASDILTIKHHDVAMVEISPSPLVYLNLYWKKDKILSTAASTFLDYVIDLHKTHSTDIPYLGPEGDIANIYFE